MKKIIFTVALTLSLCLLTACTVVVSDPENTSQVNITEASEKETSATTEAPKNSGKITMAEFEQIKSGMTYEEVVAIVGGEGELSSEVDIGIGEEYVTQIYIWYGEGLFTAGNANVTFQGGKVVSKAQFGLK